MQRQPRRCGIAGARGRANLRFIQMRPGPDMRLPKGDALQAACRKFGRANLARLEGAD